MAAVPIQPLKANVVAQLEEAESKTDSGLYLPQNAQEKPKTAKVVAVGKEVKEVKVGDRILYESYSQTEVKIGTQEYVVVKEEKIIATVK